LGTLGALIEVITDWNVFIESVPWFVRPEQTIEIEETLTGYRTAATIPPQFQALGTLLARASWTRVSIDGSLYDLLGWHNGDGARCGWLCLPPTQDPSAAIYSEHRSLLTTFGGIVQQFNEPEEENWLLNLDDALTEKEALEDISFIQDIAREAYDGFILPVELSEYYTIAKEANGNLTLCHRVNGGIIMFAHDHSFEHLTVLEKCPEYSFYTIKNVSTFSDWVSTVANQWLNFTS
jgi:hypothetical protein